MFLNAQVVNFRVSRVYRLGHYAKHVKDLRSGVYSKRANRAHVPVNANAVNDREMIVE